VNVLVKEKEKGRKPMLNPCRKKVRGGDQQRKTSHPGKPGELWKHQQGESCRENRRKTTIGNPGDSKKSKKSDIGRLTEPLKNTPSCNEKGSREAGREKCPRDTKNDKTKSLTAGSLSGKALPTIRRKGGKSINNQIPPGLSRSIP